MSAIDIPGYGPAPRPFDLVVIGAGPAGHAAAEFAASIGHTVALVDRYVAGGTALDAGGTHTKALREAAVYLDAFGKQKIYGVLLSAPPEVMFTALAARARSVGESLRQAAFDRILDHGASLVHGHARLADGHTVLVRPDGGDEIRLHGERIILATGSRPTHPAGVPFDDPGVYDCESFLTIDRKPRDLLIIGGGGAGIEYATILSALGVPTTVVDATPRLLTRMDGEISDTLHRVLVDRGVRVLLGRPVTGVSRDGGRLVATLAGGARIRTDTLLYAGGRTVDTARLGLAASGVDVDGQGRVLVDGTRRTSCPTVYAAGDVTGPTLASIAGDQGRLAACGALGIDAPANAGAAAVWAVYGLPEVAGAGLTEYDCLAAGVAYHVGRCDFSATPRGLIAGDRYGLLKLIFDRETTALVGAHALGDIASEIITTAQTMMRARFRLDDVVGMVYNTPTYSDGFRFAGLDGLRKFGLSGLSVPLPSDRI